MTKDSVRDLFKNRILWKVYLIWFFRRIVPIMVAEVVFLALVLMLFANNVFVGKVFQNFGLAAGGGYWGVLNYLWYAFLSTRLVVQVASLVILGIGALVIRDLVRTLWTYKSMWLRR